MNRQQAIDLNLKTYTGKPCKNCGSQEKYVSSYGCVTCTASRTDPDYIKQYSKTAKAKSRTQKYMKEYGKEKIAANSKKWREKPETKAKVKKYYEENKDKWLSKHLERYNITLEEYNELLYKQDNSCAICGEHESNLTKKMHVDHCHTTGKVRGLLCHSCNTGIGHLKEDKNIMLKAMEYLNC